MIDYFVPRSTHHTELFLIHYGMEDCKPGHSFGPAVRDHYLLHYITEGHGVFHVGGRSYPLSRGDGFLIYPDTVTYYEADTASPWSYCWVGFNGILADKLLKKAGLTPATPTFSCEDDQSFRRCVVSMTESRNRSSHAADIRLTGLLYELMAALIDNHPQQETVEKQARMQEYAEKVIRFIEINFANKITVSEIARSIGLNRSYLNATFRKLTHTTIQDYLIRYRIQRACELMHNQSLTIGDISRSVGYDDPLLFSKIFKKYQGMPPSEYRRKLLLP